MADEFPEDSFFRDSNVAVFEAVLQEKGIPNVNLQNEEKGGSRIHLDTYTSAPLFSTAKELLISPSSALPSTSKKSTHPEESLGNSKETTLSSQSTSVFKSVCAARTKARTRRATQKLKKALDDSHIEVDCSGTNTLEKPDVSSKDKSKNSYRPLNISKNVFASSKQSISSYGNVTEENSVLDSHSNNVEETNNNSSLLSTQQKLKLDAWGLPQSILKQYAKRGITEMFQWQVECLCCPRVLSGGNLVYSAPTSAGKTLVSEIVCIKTVLERRKKVLFVLPFVSVVREKMFYFQEIFRGSKVRVDGYMGGHSAPGGFHSLDIAVCTIEKANSLINRLMEENELAKLGAVVVDELHLIGDPHRGYLLELLLTKLKYMSLRSDEISVQLVGMSATLPNLSLLSTWLEADLFKTSFRPVPLEEFIKIGNTLLDSSLKPVRTIDHDLEIKNDTEDIVYLCLETIANGHSVLIFCPTKAWCESLAQTVASQFRSIGLKRDANAPNSLAYKLREQLNPDRIAECLELLRSCPVGLDNSVGKVVSFGVAYHHAGLSMDERDILEGCFKNGTLRVLIATTTLSSGVNLPARRVIIRSPVFQGRPIDILTYRQMVGRAGRMGVDTAGESIIICQKTEQRIVANLVRSNLKPIESCLGLGDLSASLKRAVLEVIASKVASTPEDLELYTKCTLLASSRDSKENNSSPVSSCINFLEENELIKLQTDGDGVLHYTPTPLGSACLSASIHPDEGLRLFQELQRARQCFVLENELHLVYQVTPLNVADQWGNLDWLHVLSLWEQLPSDMRRVGELVGVEDRFIVRAMRGTINLKLEKQVLLCFRLERISVNAASFPMEPKLMRYLWQREKLLIHRRFYTALALHDLVNEVPLNLVAGKFNCSRGLLQSLQQSAATYAGMVTSFCRRLGWSSVELIIHQFQDRLHFGTHRELLDLLKLPSLNGPRARALHNAGITCVSELTTADVLVVENALHSTIPFLSDKGRDGETTSDSERRRKLKGIWITGKQGLSEREAAELLIKEARIIIQAELGLAEVNWDLQKNKCPSSSSATASPLKNGRGAIHTAISDTYGVGQLQFDENLNVEDVAIQSTVKGKVEVDIAHLHKQDILKSGSSMPLMLEKKEDKVNHETMTSIKALENKAEEKILGESTTDQTGNQRGSDIVSPNVIQNAPELLEENGELQEESIENLNTSKSVSCLLDHNICDVSSLSETLENNVSLSSGNMVTPSTGNRISNTKTETLQTSMEDLFESPFPNSALAKLDEHCDNALKQRDEVTHSDLFAAASMELKDSYSGLESCGITNSVFDRLCLQEENDLRDDSSKSKQESTEKSSSQRRLSWDLFAQSPSENVSVMVTDQNKESEDLFGSFLSYDCDRGHQSDGKDHGNCQQDTSQSAISDIEDSTRSPNMFGESFEINTGLLEALDRGGSLKTEHVEEAVSMDLPCLDRKEPKTNNSNQPAIVTCVSNFSSPSLPSSKRPNEMRRKFLGFGKKQLIESEKSQTAVEPEDSLSESKQNTPTKKGNNLHLGLSRRGAKRSRELDAIKAYTVEEDSKNEVLTDSFLEAAFETVFYDTVTSCKSPIPSNPKVPFANVRPESLISNISGVMKSPDKKRRKTKVSLDEDISISSQKCVNNGNIRDPPAIQRLCTKTEETNGQCMSMKQESVSESNEVIGPPLTRKMLSMRQKSSLDEDLKQLGDNQTYPICLAGDKDCLLKNPFQSSLVENWSTFNVIDVCRNETLFKTFAKEISSSTSWSFSFTCERNQITEPSGAIGCKIIKPEKSSKQSLRSQNFSQLMYGDSILIGVAFCFGGTDAYFLTLESKSGQCVVDLSHRIQFLRRLLCRSQSETVLSVCCFDFKEHFKILLRCAGIQMSHMSVLDPKIGDWLLEPEGKEKTFPAMVLKYAEQAIDLAEHAGHVRLGLGSPALDVNQTLPGRQRCSVEAILCYEMMSVQYEQLKEAKLLSSFIDVEMPVVECVAVMELTGIGFNAASLQTLQEKILQKMCSLEEKAYSLAGRSFCLTSPADTSRVLYQELKLGQGQSLKGRQKNTSKDTLVKLRLEHPLPDVILLWRKLNAIHSKTVCPLLPSEPCSRLFGCYILHTATGRISMHEPNIQCIPRDFDLSVESKEPLSMRTSFVAPEGSMLVAADYSQLELRLLAYLSRDSKLISILNGGQDVFRNLSAAWNGIPCEEVTDNLRQKSKQLCYGIIYGMGARALADQLEVDEFEASKLMETFHATFPGIGEFLTRTVNLCRELGYVKTLLGRRRYLPGISSSNFHIKAHSERQAVNTTVQGSAADLTKTAMIAVERHILESFPHGSGPPGKHASPNVPRLVLHLHDELMYEVPSYDVDQFCLILKQEMENALKLTIKLPVKMKVGATWGTLITKNIS